MTIPFPPNPVAFTDEERDRVQKVADRYGITFDEAASALASGGIAHRVKKRTGHRPAKVYSIRKKA